MKIINFFIAFVVLLFIISCNDNAKFSTIDLNIRELSKDTIQQKIDSLKKICEAGDLVVRLGDDFISDRIRYLSVNDHSYSHAGIVVIHNNIKMICNIYPDDFTKNADTVRFDIIDSFLNKRTNLTCALYRYDLSESEKKDFETELNTYNKKQIHFDKRYDLTTDDKMYCSEMIYKALRKVTSSRIDIIQSLIPQNMQHLVAIFFKKDHYTSATIGNRKIIAIDNLYNNPHCKLIMKFALKDIPPNE